MGQFGEVDNQVLKLRELAAANTRFLSFHHADGVLVCTCVGCNDVIPYELARSSQWCDTCWGVLKLEAGYDG